MTFQSYNILHSEFYLSSMSFSLIGIKKINDGLKIFCLDDDNPSQQLSKWNIV